MYQTANLYITPDLNIADVVFDNPHLILLLEHFGIYVPLEEKSVQEICVANNLNVDLFITFANLYNGVSFVAPVHFSFDQVLTIIRFLKSSHTYYTEEKYPDIRAIIRQMYEDDNQKEMLLVEKFCSDYFKELTQHLDYEDKVAFPYMASLYNHIENKKRFTAPVKYSVKEYKEHHNDIEEKLIDLKNLLIKYLPQKNDQQKRRKLYFNLYEMEFDLNIHAKIEDLILIPLVEQMEQYLKNQSE